MFCGEQNSEKLHEYTTRNAEVFLRTMAREMDDNEMFMKLSSGDLVAIEAKYHFFVSQSIETDTVPTCVKKIRPPMKGMSRLKQGAVFVELKQGAVFVELILYIECAIEEGTYLFKVKELRDMYQNRLKDIGYDFEVNKNAFKESILRHFEEYGLQEQSNNKNMIFVFPEGMQQLLKDAFKNRDYRSEALLFSKVAKICRNELFQEENAFFDGSFPEDCQQKLLPLTKLLISMILYGPDLKGEISESQACNTTSQLLLHNAKKQKGASKSSGRHKYQREPPVPLYIGLNLHTQTRSKKVIDNLEKLGLSVSYDRILQLEHLLAKNVCEQFKLEGIVCPHNLRKGLFTIGALDNIDHNPSSISAQGSLHGMAISIIQNPTRENSGIGRNVTFKTEIADQPSLPESFALVPAVSMNTSATMLPQRKMEDYKDHLQPANAAESAWIENAMPLMRERILNEQAISWAAYHAKLQPQVIDPPEIIVLLPLFFEKADTPAMIKHGMNIVKIITSYLNPGQIPVLACDCPIFAKCKCIQWKWPATHGEDKMIIMFEGLHLEKGLWIALGDLLASSGWTDAITDVAIATVGTVDSFLKCTHITRTRHTHQLSALALSVCIMLMFFAVDHYNYSRWVSVHIQNMKSLPEDVKKNFMKNWVF